jgi:hypothetical protein
MTRTVEQGNPAPRLSPGYVHAVSPEHGEPVVFTPGQALPGWVTDALEAGAALAADEHEGSFTLIVPARPRGKGK